MYCMYCESELRRSTVPFRINGHGFGVAVDSVAAWVCHRCGETYFEACEVDEIQNACLALEKRMRK